VESISEVESKTEALETEIQTHGHSEYSSIGHSHPEYDYAERFGGIESRIEAIERGLEETIEEPVVEEIEPTHEPEPETEKPKRRHSFGR
jgi:hypothetical protein